MAVIGWFACFAFKKKIAAMHPQLGGASPRQKLSWLRLPLLSFTFFILFLSFPGFFLSLSTRHLKRLAFGRYPFRGVSGFPHGSTPPHIRFKTFHLLPLYLGFFFVLRMMFSALNVDGYNYGNDDKTTFSRHERFRSYGLMSKRTPTNSKKETVDATVRIICAPD
ncbi:hypothetical protein QBC32DRAFT_115787 [Pseudoneurospora amorphoporcata]|uniref:Uncharacterized protein n=1 Tax=Pseudoneurospora amorphoporcata TaxID=241081 RepID=A0AAN6NWW7_9PEZI|nr:hypothetical protein QBC32DRAFT_115787 [Pseudoneurospora amorphoporcata]